MKPDPHLVERLHYFDALQHAANELRRADTVRTEWSWARASARTKLTRLFARVRYRLAYYRYERARLEFLKAIH